MTRLTALLFLHVVFGQSLRAQEPPSLELPNALPIPPVVVEEVEVGPTETLPLNTGEVFGGAILGLQRIHAVTVNVATPPPESADIDVPPDVTANLPKLPPIPVTRSDFLVQQDVRSFTVSGQFCHQPTYFEETRLERYGHSHGIFQPVVSAGHFGINVLAMPYKLVVERPRSCRNYTYPFETGRTAPHYFQGYPIRPVAGAAEAAFIMGMIALIP